MTPSQALTTIRNQFYESASGFVGDSEIRTYLWDGECELNAALQCNQVSTAMTTTTSTQEYTIPTGYETITRMQYSAVRLKKVDFRELEFLDQPGYSGSMSSGNPTHYYQWGSKFGLWPIPTASATINIWGISQPASITSDSTAFTIPVQFTSCLPDYALYRMYLKDQDDGRAVFHQKLWEANVEKARRSWYKRKFADRFPVVKDESVYPATNIGII